MEVLFAVGSTTTGRRTLTVDDVAIGIRLAGPVDVDTAAFSWLTIDLTRFLPSETDESISLESEYEFIIRNEN